MTCLELSVWSNSTAKEIVGLKCQLDRSLIFNLKELASIKNMPKCKDPFLLASFLLYKVWLWAFFVHIARLEKMKERIWGPFFNDKSWLSAWDFCSLSKMPINCCPINCYVELLSSQSLQTTFHKFFSYAIIILSLLLKKITRNSVFII